MDRIQHAKTGRDALLESHGGCSTGALSYFVQNDTATGRPELHYQYQSQQNLDCEHILANQFQNETQREDNEEILRQKWEQMHKSQKSRLNKKKHKILKSTQTKVIMNRQDQEKCDIDRNPFRYNMMRPSNSSNQFSKDFNFNNDTVSDFQGMQFEQETIGSCQNGLVYLPYQQEMHNSNLEDRSEYAKPKSDPKYCLQVFERNKKWQEEKDQKQRDKKLSLEENKKAEEMKECKFHPKVIGHNYNNTGLPQSKSFTDLSQKNVQDRCLEW